MERVFVERMAHSGDAAYSAEKAGYSAPMVQGARLMAKPAIRAEVARIYREKMLTEGLPAAYAVHMKLMNDDKTPAGARVSLVGEMYKQTLGAEEASAGKEPSEMSYDELQESIDRLRREADARAENAKDITPDPGVFD